METKLKRIAEISATTKKSEFTALYHHISYTSLRDAMNSRLFRELRDGGYLLEDHPGGCTLYERRADVERIMNEAN